MKSMSSQFVLLIAASNNDASSTRKVYLLAAGLAMLGILLLVVTVWFWRNTRHDPELLGPLEVMSKRKFRELDGGAQQKLLDDERPAGAEPMRWGLVRGDAEPQEAVDLSVAGRGLLAGYDDLRDPVSAPAPVPAADPAIESGPVAWVPAGVDATDAPNVEPNVEPVSADASNAPESLPAIDALDIDELLRLNNIEVAAAPAPAEPAAGDSAGPGAHEPDVEPVEQVASTKATPLARTADIDAAAKLPIVIVPIDHDLPAADRFSSKVRPGSAAPVQPRADEGLDGDDLPDDEDDVLDDADVTRAEPRPSIDPLLRMFERNTD